MKRYHPALVTIHWIMAILMSVSLVMGGFVLSNIPLDDPGKSEALQGHMIAGAVIGFLLLVRIFCAAHNNPTGARRKREHSLQHSGARSSDRLLRLDRALLRTGKES